ncbi:MAG: hypothetical protein IPF99_42605 [Deltaproteobacteria bacterium]|nr:hypothetical protein [Deltaproteobacteria bacterium]
MTRRSEVTQRGRPRMRPLTSSAADESVGTVTESTCTVAVPSRSASIARARIARSATSGCSRERVTKPHTRTTLAGSMPAWASSARVGACQARSCSCAGVRGGCNPSAARVSSLAWSVPPPAVRRLSSTTAMCSVAGASSVRG